MATKAFRGGVSPAQAHRLRQQAKRTKKAARLAKLTQLAKGTQAGTPMAGRPRQA